MRSSGMVYIVGAGPGDPDLITVRGLRCLQRADVVVYDRLISAELLEEAPFAEQIYVGKAPGHHVRTQEQINAILVRAARRGQTVVRLKGGDPFVFGRGGEECLALAQAGVPFEVVPGITSAIAVPAYAGIPVTQRGIATSFTVVTGHTAGDDACAIDWDALPRAGTLIILMGLRNLPRIATQLMNHGRSADTPVAVIAHGTTSEQTVLTGTLTDMATDISTVAQRVQSPATIVVGEVVRLAEQIGWFHPQTPLPILAALELQPAVPSIDVPATEWRN